MNHSPMAAPAYADKNWLVAESDEEATTMVVYSRAPASSNVEMIRAILDCFCPMATYMEYTGLKSLSPFSSAALFCLACEIIVSMAMVVLPVCLSPIINSR